MTHWVFTCYIYDATYNLIMKNSFLKKKEAEKWGYKKIMKYNKIDEWYCDIIQTAEKITEF